MNYEQLTFENILESALAKVPEDIDKRPGSIIYDALAPACYQLAEYYLNMYMFSQEISLQTATDEYLDRKVADFGLSRIMATKAIKKAVFKDSEQALISVPIGSRFSTISETNALVYEVINQHLDEDGSPVEGTYDLQCTTAGKDGNDYTGNLIAVSFINGLASAVMSDVVIAGRDDETDEELRARCHEVITKKEFAGNVAAYKTFMKELEGVGYAQIYPTWNGGGTVKCVIVDYEFEPIADENLRKIKALVDPEEYSGEGVGIAPIGHQVTISTATKKTINIHTDIQLAVGYQIAQLKDSIKQAVEAYFQDTRKRWDVANDKNTYALSIYIAQINRAMLSVTGVDNVKNTTLDGEMEDIDLVESNILQEVPFLGEITYGEN